MLSLTSLSFISVSRVCVSDANCPCSLSFMRPSGSMFFDRYSISARASCGSVFFTDWRMTLNWLVFTTTTRTTCGTTTSKNTLVLPVISTTISSLGRSFFTNFPRSSSSHSVTYVRSFSSRMQHVNRLRCRSMPIYRERYVNPIFRFPEPWLTVE